MIILSIIAIVFALAIDFALGEPKNKLHPTVWIGTFIGKLVPLAHSSNPKVERLGGLVLVVSITILVATLLFVFDLGVKHLENFNYSSFSKILVSIFVIITVGFLLKTTFAIKGMEQHANKIMEALSKSDLEDARAKLSLIVKRNTKNLDRQHIISATIESISENTVDGIVGPLFYFAFFGLVGSFVYRTINTIDSMIGYKTDLFINLGWFGANCDKVLNFVPSRLTSLIMILASLSMRGNWRQSLIVMKRDGQKTESPNAGYPMATMAGALGVRFEKLGHYSLGDEISEISEQHVKTAISIMKITTVLFVALFTIPVMLILSYIGWWSFV